MGTSKFVFLFCCLIFQSAFSEEQKISEQNPFVVSESVQKPTYVFQSLKLSNIETLNCDSTGDSELISKWKNWVRSKLRSTSILDLIEMQKKLFGRFGDVRIFNLIQEGTLGSLRPISCLERKLFARHLQIQKELAPNSSTAGYGVEFIAYILSHPERPQELKMIQSQVRLPRI